MDEITAIACNYAAGTSIARTGARCYLLWRTGGDNRRAKVLVKSRGGRWVAKWEPIVMLDHFRFVRVPSAGAEYATLKERTGGAVPFDLADITACRVGALGEARWRNYLDKHSAKPARKE